MKQMPNCGLNGKNGSLNTSSAEEKCGRRRRFCEVKYRIAAVCKRNSGRKRDVFYTEFRLVFKDDKR